MHRIIRVIDSPTSGEEGQHLVVMKGKGRPEYKIVLSHSNYMAQRKLEEILDLYLGDHCEEEAASKLIDLIDEYVKWKQQE